jgi:ketosteroid isomerase-like protein
MQDAQNTKLVQDAYGDFGRGDIASIIGRMDVNVIWHAVIGAGKHVPTSGVKNGPAAVAQFFKILAQSIAFTRFEPREFIAQGDKVVVLGFYSATAIPTGRQFESEWVMIFTVKNGKVTEFKEFSDSAQLNAAFA